MGREGSGEGSVNPVDYTGVRSEIRDEVNRQYCNVPKASLPQSNE